MLVREGDVEPLEYIISPKADRAIDIAGAALVIFFVAYVAAHIIAWAGR